MAEKFLPDDYVVLEQRSLRLSNKMKSKVSARTPTPLPEV